MKIDECIGWIVTFALDEPYSIAYESVSHVDVLFIRLITSSGIVGHGCAAPSWHITGESAEASRVSFNDTVADVLRKEDPLRRAAILGEIKKVCPGQPSLRAGVEMALLDILGKIAGLPLWLLLGGYRDRIATSITIGIESMKDTVRNAKRLVSDGFSILKLKGGLDLSGDVARVAAVRKAVGSKIELRFDANQGYSVDEALEFMRETSSTGIEIFEQPTAMDRFDSLGTVTQHSNAQVAADESLKNLRDALRLARGNHADMVNIKLMKVGGIADGLHINSVAKAAGLETMIGCMDEPGLSIAAGLHLALALPNVTCADLDGHLALRDDSTKSAVILKNGVLHPSPDPGVGCTVPDPA